MNAHPIDPILFERVHTFLFAEENSALLGLPATAEEIAAAEKTLNLKFNAQYCEFITLFGGVMGGVAINAFNNGSLIGKATVIDLTLKFMHEQKEAYHERLQGFLRSFG